jgi:hypothetical protein
MVWKLLNKKRISNETSHLGQRPGNRPLLDPTEGRECPSQAARYIQNGYKNARTLKGRVTAWNEAGGVIKEEKE